MQDNPLHQLNTIPNETMARLTLAPSTQRLMRDVSPLGVKDSQENRNRRAVFYADLPDRQQAGIVNVYYPDIPSSPSIQYFDQRSHDRRRSKGLAAALVLLLLFAGAHRAIFGPTRHPVVLSKAVR